ncbi:uncharacterized protein LOC100184344 [Ciona intestinalis]
MDWARSMVPHVCFFIDSSFSSTLEGLELLMYSQETEQEHFLVQEDLERVWKSGEENFSILPCLSVRSGLDLFLSVKQYPPGSEIIVSSINIPTVIKILHHHNLKIRSCDIDIKTMSPSVQQFKSLITEKTVATLLAHIYGKRFDMQPFINLCKDQNIVVLEDCAETFYGLQFKGHPESDITFFSFGTIKISTVFGGAILRIKNRQLYNTLREHHSTYPIQPKSEYAMKLAKYSVITTMFNSPFVVRWGVSAFRAVGIDHKDVFVPMLRGFPSNLFKGIRRQPCSALLKNLTFKLVNFDEKENKLVQEKGDYVTKSLPDNAVCVGTNAFFVNYWLFPILVEKPDQVCKILNEFGVDAARGTTQLQVVVSDGEATDVTQAQFLMQHVVYLPVHKLVPYSELDKILSALKQTLFQLGCTRLKLPS